MHLEQKIDGKKIGSFGDITNFSFDPVKIVTSIDGGCVVVKYKRRTRIFTKIKAVRCKQGYSFAI